jgi:hypothetical protein
MATSNFDFVYRHACAFSEFKVNKLMGPPRYSGLRKSLVRTPCHCISDRNILGILRLRAYRVFR